MSRLNLVGEYKATILVQDNTGRPKEYIGRGTRNIRKDATLLRDNALNDAKAQYLYDRGRLGSGSLYEIRTEDLQGLRTQIVEEKFTYEASKKKGIRVREETFKSGKKFLVARDKQGRFKSRAKI